MNRRSRTGAMDSDSAYSGVATPPKGQAPRLSHLRTPRNKSSPGMGEGHPADITSHRMPGDLNFACCARLPLQAWTASLPSHRVVARIFFNTRHRNLATEIVLSCFSVRCLMAFSTHLFLTIPDFLGFTTFLFRFWIVRCFFDHIVCWLI